MTRRALRKTGTETTGERARRLARIAAACWPEDRNCSVDEVRWAYASGFMACAADVAREGAEEEMSVDEQSLKLERELSAVLNANSMENKSNTPDFVLGEFLVDALTLLGRTINARDRWYGMVPFPGSDWRRDGQLAGYLSGALPELHQTHPEAIYKAIQAFRALPEEPCSTPCDHPAGTLPGATSASLGTCITCGKEVGLDAALNGTGGGEAP